jgi:hypothetical protein
MFLLLFPRFAAARDTFELFAQRGFDAVVRLATSD